MDKMEGTQKVYVDDFMTEEEVTKLEFNAEESMNNFIIK